MANLVLLYFIVFYCVLTVFYFILTCFIMFYPVSPRLTVFLLCFCVLNFSLRVNKSCNCSASCPAAFHLLLFYSIIFFAFRIIARAYSCTMYINPRLAALCALLFNSFTQLASVCQCVCARVPWDISHIKVGQAMARDRHRTIPKPKPAAEPAAVPERAHCVRPLPLVAL